MTTIDEIRDNFALLDDWDDRYRYVIELGRTLEPMPEAEHSAANKVQGCASQVWLSRKLARNGDGDAGAELSRRQRRAYRARPDRDPADALFRHARRRTFWPPTRSRCSTNSGFREHLTPQRSNGLRSMVERIRATRARRWRRRPSETGLLQLFRPAAALLWPRPICLASCERATA